MFVHALWDTLAELAPWLLLGTAVAGALHWLIPERFIQRQFQGVSGVFKAVFLGVPLPLCSCGVIPAGLGLKKDGASDGATVGFLISTPQTGVDSVFVSASFLGWPFALFKVVGAAVTGIVGGLLTTLVEEKPLESDSGEAGVDWGTRPGPREVWAHSVFLLRSIWRWLVFGVVVSAFIEVAMPEQLLGQLGEMNPWLAGLGVLGLSIPLYVCATSSVPIAAALVASGMPTGLALVFLMAGPATNVATIGAIFRGLGARVTALYLVVIIVGSLGFGVAFDSLLSLGTAGSTGGMGHDHTGPLSALCALILLVAFVFFAGEEVLAAWRRRVIAKAIAVGGQEVRVSVGGMTCGGCVSRLERVLSGAEGVESVQVTLKPGGAVVKGTVSEATVVELIEGAGFQVP